MVTRKAIVFSSAAAASILAGCAGLDPADINTRPAFVGALQTATYDGVSNDLLTGGLGKTGLQSATAPVYGDPANPTPDELRRAAIYSNYRGLVDTSANGGYGLLYGPNIDSSGNPAVGEGMIAGEETVAFADDGSGQLNVTMMVQIPGAFDKSNPCIVTATSSGSRGVYGAIGTAGEWGLKRGCAVAYVDKGTGVGFHNLQANTVSLVNGMRSDANVAGKNSNYTAHVSAPERAAFNAAAPHRFAIKQAHSQQNPEKDWGKFTLQGIEFAFYVLNQKFGMASGDGSRVRTIKPENTIVIASSVSNGGGAALLAAEQDGKGLIDGVAVGEPVTEVVSNPALVITRGGAAAAVTSKGLLDVVTIANLYQPCAVLSASLASSPGKSLVDPARAANRCMALKDKNLLVSTGLAAQADESLAVLHANGWERESDVLHASHYPLTSAGLAMLYANMYGRFSVMDNLCGQSLGSVSAAGAPAALTAAQEAQLFASANGTPTGGVSLINNNSVGGALLDPISISPSTGQADYNIDAAICLRNLVTGTDVTTGAPLAGPVLANSQRVKSGMGEVARGGNLRAKPAIIVHGRSDTLIPVNHNSRVYFGANKLVEGAGSKLSYIEITNAQHFDAFNSAIPGYDTRMVPMHYYFNQAMDLIYAHLKNGAGLPPSQVVRTTPRGGTDGAAPAITAANVPPIRRVPIAADRIRFEGTTVFIPD